MCRSFWFVSCVMLCYAMLCLSPVSISCLVYLLCCPVSFVYLLSALFVSCVYLLCCLSPVSISCLVYLLCCPVSFVYLLSALFVSCVYLLCCLSPVLSCLVLCVSCAVLCCPVFYPSCLCCPSPVLSCAVLCYIAPVCSVCLLCYAVQPCASIQCVPPNASNLVRLSSAFCFCLFLLYIPLVWLSNLVFCFILFCSVFVLFLFCFVLFCFSLCCLVLYMSPIYPPGGILNILLRSVLCCVLCFFFYVSRPVLFLFGASVSSLLFFSVCFLHIVPW